MSKSRKKLDLWEVEHLASVGCTVGEISIYLGWDEAALKKSRGCIRAISRGWVRLQITLRRRMFELAVGGNINVLMFLHNNPPSLHALRAEHEELKEELRLKWIAAERQRWELHGWSFAERTGAADSDGTRHSEGLSSQSPSKSCPN
jgi:hypothetical protein